MYVYIDMTSKTISITKEVYELLLKLKLKGESFSETIARLAKKGGKLSECAGLWSDMSEEEIQEIKTGIKQMRKTLDETLKRGLELT
ncbi:MAG: antitoxin VapB family protein [Euryarchaeota archaeon]|nr:antitoxin VapB family protein [Euryarchaeota archaeon]